MTDKEIQIDAFSKSAKEIVEQAITAAMEAVELAIMDVNKATEDAQGVCEQAASQAGEISNSIMIANKEAMRTAKEVANSAINEANKAIEEVRSMSAQTVSDAEKIMSSAQEWAEETTKAAKETADRLVDDAKKALATAEEVSDQMISRTEVFLNSARTKAEEMTQTIGETAELSVKEVNEAATKAQEALRQAAGRADEINSLADYLAEQATRSVSEAVELARKSFVDNMARSIDQAEEAKRSKPIPGEEKGKTKKIPENIESENIVTQANVPEENSLEDNVADQKITELASKTNLENQQTQTEVTTYPSVDLNGEVMVTDGEKQIEVAESPNMEYQEEVIGGAADSSLNANSFNRFKNIIINITSDGNCHLVDFQDRLKRLDNVKILWIDGSLNGTKIAIELPELMNLASILRGLPIVRDITLKSKEMFVSLKDINMN